MEDGHFYKYDVPMKGVVCAVLGLFCDIAVTSVASAEWLDGSDKQLRQLPQSTRYVDMIS
jgi:hypothetical protein